MLQYVCCKKYCEKYNSSVIFDTHLHVKVDPLKWKISLPSSLERPSWQSLPLLNFPSTSVRYWEGEKFNGYIKSLAYVCYYQNLETKHEWVFLSSPAVLLGLQQWHHSYSGLHFFNLQAPAIKTQINTRFSLIFEWLWTKKQKHNHKKCSYLLSLFHLKSLQ